MMCATPWIKHGMQYYYVGLRGNYFFPAREGKDEPPLTARSVIFKKGTSLESILRSSLPALVAHPSLMFPYKGANSCIK